MAYSRCVTLSWNKAGCSHCALLPRGRGITTVGKQPYPVSKSHLFSKLGFNEEQGQVDGWGDEDEAEQTGKSTKWASGREMFCLGHFSWCGFIFTRLLSLSGNICWASSLSAEYIVWHWYLQGKSTHIHIQWLQLPVEDRHTAPSSLVHHLGSHMAPALPAGTASVGKGSEPNPAALVLENLVWLMLAVPVAHDLASASFYLLSDHFWSAQLNSHTWNYPSHPCLFLWNCTSVGFPSLGACMQAFCVVMLCLLTLLFLLQPISLFSHFSMMSWIWKSILHILFVPLLSLNFMSGSPSTMTLLSAFLPYAICCKLPCLFYLMKFLGAENPFIPLESCSGGKLSPLFPSSVSVHQHNTQNMWVLFYLLVSAMREPVHPAVQGDLNKYLFPDRPFESAFVVNPFSNHAGLLSWAWLPMHTAPT